MQGTLKIARAQILIGIVVASLIEQPGAAQETADSLGSTKGMEEIGRDTDPTKPVAFQLRDEFARLNATTSVNSFIFRVDRLFLEGLGVPGPARGVLARLDIPVNTFSNPSTTETGLGDIYMQALVAPRIQGNFVMAAGSGLVLPTASSTLLGKGKWVASPAIAPVWLFPREGVAYLKIQDWFSFAGQSNRQKVHYLTVTGVILRRISKQWWALLDTESNTDWLKDGHTWYKTGILLGIMFSNRVGLSLKGEIPFGQYRPGDWTIKGGLFLTRF